MKNDAKYLNLNKIDLLRSRTKTKVAFGLHCEDKNVIYASIPFKPESIFFYIKLDNKNTYPDNKHAIRTNDLYEVSKSLKNMPIAVK